MTEQMRKEALMAHSKEELVDLLLTFYHYDVAIKFELMDFMKEWEIDRQSRIEKARKSMREANDEQRFADKEARGETTSARIKSFAAGVASNVGNSIKNKVTSTASGIWNRHLERRNERWANAFTNSSAAIKIIMISTMTNSIMLTPF